MASNRAILQDSDTEFFQEDIPERLEWHPLYQDCVSHAEAIESEHGLYDNTEAISKSLRRAFQSDLESDLSPICLDFA